tara:strand:- start:1077 stop:2054 length:978 start_codon:yes stop_codon:yes gene_type:complete
MIHLDCACTPLAPGRERTSLCCPCCFEWRRALVDFFELGAYNGVDFSNTLILEKCFGWTGLLIEANSDNFAQLEHSGRSAVLKHSAICAGQGRQGETTNITKAGGAVAGQVESMSARFVATQRRGDDLTQETVPCQSLTSLVKQSFPMASPIDFLSLDVEGAEYEVLKHAHPRMFSVVLVETEGGSVEKNEAVHSLLLSSGLVLSREVRVPSSSVYVRPELQLTPSHARPFLPPALLIPGAQPGYCAATREGQRGDCDAGERGSWRISRFRKFNVSSCVHRCRWECKQCRYVTVSLQTNDCSWYSSCDFQQLKDAGMDHQSLPVF